MPIEFRCAECAAEFEVDDDLIGRTIKCRECHGFNRVPSPAKKPAPKAEPKPELQPKPQLEPSPASSPFRIRYRCPFCNSGKPPIWANYWTPTSTLVAFFLLSVAVMPFLYCLALILSPLVLLSGREAWEGRQACLIAGVGIVFSLAAIGAVWLFLRSRFVKERRQVCPDCNVRVS
jgi:hypothetical protein